LGEKPNISGLFLSGTARALFLRGRLPGHARLGRFPEVGIQIDAGLDDLNAFGFEEFLLKGSVRLANEDFAALAHDAMPWNAFSRGSGSHGAARTARTARQTQSLRERSIR
jgi:hypothetical protein